MWGRSLALGIGGEVIKVGFPFCCVLRCVDGGNFGALICLVYDEVGVRSELVECCAFFGGDIVLGGEGCVCVLLQSR